MAYISETKPIIKEMLEDKSLRSFSSRAQEPPEHPYVFLPLKYAPVSQIFVYKRKVLKKIWKF